MPLGRVEEGQAAMGTEKYAKMATEEK